MRKHLKDKGGFSLLGAFICMALLCVLIVTVLAGETKYATGTASAAVTFDPGTGRTVVESVYATCDKEDGAVKIYARGGTGKKIVTTAPAATNVIYVSNSSYGLTNGDSVVYFYADGTAPLYRTISGQTTSNVTLSSAISTAGSTSDYLYEVTQQGQIVVGYDGAAVGVNDGLATSGNVFETPGDSPLYCVLDGTSNSVLQVTVDK